MKQRILSSVIGLLILFAAMLLFGTVVPNIAIALISALAVWELLNATGCTKDKLLCILALGFSLLVPFLSFLQIMGHLMLICFIYAAGLFVVFLYHHSRLSIQEVAMAFMFSLMIPFSLTALLYLRDRFGNPLGIFYTMLTFGSAWLSDTFAYFTGRFCGKHKLAPVISPKKTIEGAVGGIVGAMVTAPLVLWVISLVLSALGMPIEIYYGRMICVIPFLSGLGIIGDLSASVIKRQFGVKDYGSIMPGHGGVMDRFDSVLLIAPMVFIICCYLPLAAVV